MEENKSNELANSENRLEEVVFTTQEPVETFSGEIVEAVEVTEPLNSPETQTQTTGTTEEQIRQQYNVQDGQPVIIIHNENNANQNAQQTQQTVVQPSVPWLGHEKSKWVAFWWCFFLGAVGAHQFYTGWTGKGFIMLILFFTGIGTIVAQVWALVNLFQIAFNSFTTKWGQRI